MLDLVVALQIAAVSAFTYMTAVYLLSLMRRDTSIVDVAWGLGFVLVGTGLWWAQEELVGIFQMAYILVAIWGLRLFIHILNRKAGSSEDWRYANWRQEWGGNHWWRSYLQVFLLQASLMLVIATPLIVAAASSTPLGWVSWLGVAIWALGFYFEAVGDWQLSQFLKRRSTGTLKPKRGRKKGKKAKSVPEIMQTGLWRYTRHPNYFGEITQWWGVWLVVLPANYGVFAIISPLMITFLLLKISGIPMLEKKYDDNREFQKYKQRTSPLIPLPPKKG